MDEMLINECPFGYTIGPDVYYEIWDMNRIVFENGELRYIVEQPEDEESVLPWWLN